MMSDGGSAVDSVTNGLDFGALVGVWAVGEGVADNDASLKVGIGVGDDPEHDAYSMTPVLG